MKKTQEIINNFIKLGEDYKNLSRKYFGWNNTYLDLKKYLITDEYMDSDVYRFYFAESTNHTDTTVNGVQVAFHSPPKITIESSCFYKLDKLYEEALITFKKVKRNMRKQNLYKEQDEKKQKIEQLQKMIDELK